MSTEPKTISREALKDALHGLGIDGFEDVKKIGIDADGVRVERVRRGEKGQLILAGNYAATVSTLVAYTEDQCGEITEERANG